MTNVSTLAHNLLIRSQIADLQTRIVGAESAAAVAGPGLRTPVSVVGRSASTGGRSDVGFTDVIGLPPIFSA